MAERPSSQDVRASRFIFDDTELAEPRPGHVRVEVPESAAEAPDVLDAIDAAHSLPDYRGTTWNALIDLLTDPSWFDGDGIVLVHPAWPGEMSATVQRTYLEVLKHAMDRLNGRSGTTLRAVFPGDAEAACLTALGPPHH